MGLIHYPRPSDPQPDSGPSSQPAPPAMPEPFFAVPVAARKRTGGGPPPKERFIFYSFLFADSAEAAVARLPRELRDEGLEFIELTGHVLTTSIPAWTEFVAQRFDWIKDALPTAQQLAEGSRGIVYYSPKITQL